MCGLSLGELPKSRFVMYASPYPPASLALYFKRTHRGVLQKINVWSRLETTTPRIPPRASHVSRFRTRARHAPIPAHPAPFDRVAALVGLQRQSAAVEVTDADGVRCLQRPGRVFPQQPGQAFAPELGPVLLQPEATSAVLEVGQARARSSGWCLGNPRQFGHSKAESTPISTAARRRPGLSPTPIGCPLFTQNPTHHPEPPPKQPTPHQYGGRDSRSSVT